mgnify:FL=1
MSLLSQEDQGLLADFIDGKVPADDAQESEVNPSDPAEDDQLYAEEEGDAGDSDSEDYSPADEDDPDPGHRVPYNRFKQVLDARNGFKGEIDRLSEELEQSRASHAATPAAPPRATEGKAEASEHAWLEEILKGDDDSSKEVADKLRAEFSGMNDRIYQQEVAVAGQQLEAEVEGALHSFPSVPREVIYQAVADNPDVTALQVAEHYASTVGGIEEAAIARYISENGLEETESDAAPEAAPRVQSSGDMEMQSPPEDTKLLSIDEGTSALRSFLSNNPFG